MNTQNAFEYLNGDKKFDRERAFFYAQKGAEDGIVLLENKNRTLPLAKGTKAAFFGRMQKKYIMLGSGSGGRVVPLVTTNLFDSLAESGLEFDKEVSEFYDAYVRENPYDDTGGWIHPEHQTEPELCEELVSLAAERSENALFVITRMAGEDKDMSAGRGGYMLTETEKSNLALIRRHFKRVILLLNTCGIIDMSEITSIAPDAILMLWTGGMLGASAAARVIMGEVNPSGRLPDTMAVSREAYPAFSNFGKAGESIYAEDIYVGYRHFNTFAEQDIIYPFGYGLSYTEFAHFFIDIHRHEGVTRIRAVVSNVGTVEGREVLQCYVKQPCGRLGKPKRVLAAFAKTPLLKAGESCTVDLYFDDYSISSYDDSGATGNRYCYMLEAGEYIVELGSNSMQLTEACAFTVNSDILVRSAQSALAPITPFERTVNRMGVKTTEPAPLRMNTREPIPQSIPQVEKDGLTLDDVYEGRATVDELIARLDDNDLIHIVRAEGMASPKVTPGTAAAFVGITPSLKALRLPTLCCTDGPSGIRIMGDVRCVAYPAATCLAATFDTELVCETYYNCGCELATYCVDILLGPGTNIHRDPLCGRNFEYFSEDPLLAGRMAAAVCRGLDEAGVSGAVKHFMANNQELDRHGVNAVLSERAVREIYARPFELCIKESGVRSVMTSYNPVNNRWAASNYELTVKLLREDFGFDGFVMSDWWARVSADDGSASVTNLRAMAHARNDVYMVCPDAVKREDNLASSLADGSLTRGELQECARNLINFSLISLSYLAQRNGYGLRDLKSEIEGKSPIASYTVSDNRVVIASPNTQKAIIRVSFVSDTPVLTQTNVGMSISTKNAGGFIVGGTEGNTVSDLREISLNAGDNEFVFTPESDLCRVTAVEVFEA
ncbi:MAG: glycoside hydrolase family 3 protein [Clostridia bacterium]|nr:glycoside hydrolase family 3 protein [Clostridia bacterium]